nr:VOC family protein [Haladaptatus sp. W1]
MRSRHGGHRLSAGRSNPATRSSFARWLRQATPERRTRPCSTGVLVWRAGQGITDPESPGTPRVLFQAVPESKSVKNRLHLDVRVGDGREAVVTALEGRGASVLHRGQQGPSTWITMTDPEGNEFCVS